MMRLVVMLMLLALIAAGLYITKPSKAQFAEFYARNASPEVVRALGLEGSLGTLVRGAAQGVIQATLEENTLEDDYLVASVFIVPLPGEDVRVLGVANQFVSLNRGRP